MVISPTTPLVAVDVGNTRMKFGYFDVFAAGLPAPASTLDLHSADGDLDELNSWLSPVTVASAAWWIGSVNRPAATRLLDWLRRAAPQREIILLAAGDLPLQVTLPRPDMVGVDRLLNAVGANALRSADHGAAVVDLGTAITVDWVSPAGAFEGGAILPGIGLSARALHEFTDLLPLIPMSELADPPPALGASTIEALRAGLYWGAVGGVKELIDRLGSNQSLPPQVFLTGGAAPAVAGLLTPSAVYVPHLTLGGIALAAASRRT